MKRLILLISVALAGFTAACGGGSSATSTPPPPMGNFTLASLKGNYAFSMNGQSGFNGSPISRVGSFIADGMGGISNAMEDLDNGVTISPIQLGTGTYTMSSNGTGVLTLASSSTTPLILNISLSAPAPAGQGLMIEADLNDTASGTFLQQNINDFTQPFAAANYVFDVSGSDINRFPVSFVGEFGATTGGALLAGVFDRNDGGIQTDPSGPISLAAGGNYAADPVNQANFGRGTVSFSNGMTFAFYPVNQTHIKMLEIDGVSSFTSGDVFEQSGTIPTTTAGWTPGNFAFIVGGSALSNAGPLTRAARFATDGKGNFNASTIREDSNVNGSFGCIDPKDGHCSSSATGTYTIDTANAGSGRGTFTITINGQQFPITAVFYLYSPTQAFIQDTSANVVGDGTMLAQTGSFSNSALAGNYVFNLSGVNGAAGFEEDFVGQYGLSSAASNNITGVSNFVELGSNSNRIPEFTNVATSGTFKLDGDGTLRNGYQIIFTPGGGSPAATLNFNAYIVSPTQMFLVGIDPDRVTAGTTLVQAQ